MRLVTRGAMYAYADPRLEDLSPAQKQLLRTGPRNTRLMQARTIALIQDQLPERFARALAVVAD